MCPKGRTAGKDSAPDRRCRRDSLTQGGGIAPAKKKWKGAIWGKSADFAVLDREYTMSLSMKQMISGAFDTLSRCMETYMGAPRTTNLSDEINEATQRSTIRHIRTLLTDPMNDEARSELLWSSPWRKTAF